MSDLLCAAVARLHIEARKLERLSKELNVCSQDTCPAVLDIFDKRMDSSIVKGMKIRTENKSPSRLKGWKAIAEFLGQTPSVAQRWHKEGMPVTIEGRFVHAEPEELTRWVGSESGK